MSRSTTRDEIFSSSLSGASNSLLRIAGGWGNIGGPGLFMTRVIVSGTVTSIFTGMVGSMVAALLYDTAALPFLVCSCAGFILGAVGFYRDAVRKSLIYLERYPRLIRLHLDANFPAQRFDAWSVERLRRASLMSWKIRSMLVVGWLSAGPAIEAIADVEEQKIIEAAAAETTESEKDS